MNGIREPWKAHKMFGKSKQWYVGPDHGRLIVEVYPDRMSAIYVAQMQRWLLKKLRVKPSKEKGE